ncbi:MAG: carboxypeptidase regulatory-like domain-containing protein [Candidatus Eisenbacteria bacterium]|nr:carboxypeptidase regulatory-like domain-containing protein [Candidatus Eisenbacteria bacterium]
MSPCRLWIPLLLLSASWACRAAAAPGPPVGSVSGIVVGAGGSRIGIPGAVVTAKDPWTGPLDTVRTDAGGAFLFRGLPAGRAVLEFRARGFAARGPVTVPVRAGDTVSGVRLVLAPTAVIEGRVVDREGRPLAGAEVSALDARTRTRGDGRFRLTEVRPVQLQVLARTSTHRESGSPTLTLRPGETRRIPEIALLRGRRVTGRVLDAHSRPIPRAEVGGAGRSTRTDARGEFRLGGLPPGGSIYVYARAYDYANQELPSDSSDVRDLTLHLLKMPREGPRLMLSMPRDTWLPGERVTATAWAPGSGAVEGRIEAAGNAGAPPVRKQSFRVAAGGRAALAFPAPSPGTYVLSAKAGGETKNLEFLVSEVALVAEQWPQRARVRAVRFADGAGVAGLPLMDESGRKLGITDAAGLAEVPLRTMMEVRSADPRRPARVVLGQDPVAPPPALLAVLTDRPAVRPGGSLGVKVIARSPDGAGLGAVADSCVSIEVAGAESDPVTRQGRLDASGVAVDSLTLPSKLQFGAARLTVRASGATATRMLPLTSRPTPELSVLITPDRAVALPGDTVRAMVTVRREDGLPASSVNVTYSVNEWGGGYDWGPDRGFGGPVWTGLARREQRLTDARGEVEFLEVLPGLLAGDTDLHLDVVAQEPGGEAVSASGLVHALASARHVSFLAAEASVAGRPLVATFRLLALPRRPVASGGIRVELYRLVRGRRAHKAVFLESATLATGADGEAQWKSGVRAKAGTEYRVRASAADSLGRVAQADYTWWTPGLADGEESEVTFELTAAADTVESREAGARFRIRAGFAGVAHVAFAGREPLAWLPDIRFTPGVTEFTVPGGCFGAGGVRVAAYAAFAGDVHRGEATVTVRRDAVRLRVEVKPERDALAPRDTMRLEVTTRDASGRPVSAEVALTAYDRGMLAFGPDANPDLLDAFWGPRPLPLEVRSGVRRHERAGGKDSEADVRRDFRDVAFWAPRLVTGPDGSARVAFRVPDNLTTWRVTAHAVAAGTAVGMARADVVVRRPVALQLSRPEALVAGDSVALRVVLREAKGEPERHFRDWQVEVRGGTWAGPAPEVTVSPEKPGAWVLPVRVAADAETLRVTVVARGEGAADGLERAIPVTRPWRTLFGSGAPPGSALDSTVTLRWAAPLLSAALQEGGMPDWVPREPGPERLAALAARENLLRLGLGPLCRPLHGGGEEPDEPGPGDPRRAADAAGAGATARERARMFDALGRPGSLLRPDRSLDIHAARMALLAATVGRDVPEPAVLRQVRAMAASVAEALAKQRITPEERGAALRVLAAVSDRFGLTGGGAAMDAGPRAFPEGAIRRDFSTPYPAEQVWWAADPARGGADRGGAQARVAQLAVLGGRGRGWGGLWTRVVLSHLDSSDVAGVAARLPSEPAARGEIPGDLVSWEPKPEVVPVGADRGEAGGLRVTHRRAHAPLSSPVDTSMGALAVKLYRDLPDTNAWGEPGTRPVECAGRLRLGETVRMEVRTTRAVECEALEMVVPLCGAFDTRPPAGSEGSEARPAWTRDRRLPGRIECKAWRPHQAGALVWEARLRVTHEGRFTQLPPVLRSTVFPELYLPGPALGIEVGP